MMDTLTLDEARSLGQWTGTDILEPQTRYLQTEMNLENVIRVVDLLGRYSGRFRFDHTVAGRKHILTIHHDMGPKWSAFYEGAASKVLRDILHIDSAFSATDELCSFEFELPGVDERKAGSD